MIDTVGVVGTGNMGSALVKGWLRCEGAGVRLIVWDKIEAAAQRLVAPGRVSLAGSLDDLVPRTDAVLVVVKPKDAPEVLGAIAPLLRDKQILVSSMAGVALEQIRAVVGPGPCLFRVMPNLGVELGVGAIAICPEPTAPATEVQTVVALFADLGVVESVPESMLDAVTAVAGSGPAFIALAVEGLEDGAVAAGLPRATARTAVRHAALATARLLPLHSDSPAELREHLASAPMDQAGTDVLEERGVREAFQRAIEAAVERSHRLQGAGASNSAPPDASPPD
jgi:pyrroline-5-carboxylate reductase